MRVFQIIDKSVLIIKGNEQYSDSFDNFKVDSGLTNLPSKIVYDDTQKKCCVDDEFTSYPDSKYEGYIDNVTAYIEAKAKREYVPPTLSELKAKALSIQYTKYLAKKEADVVVDDLRFSTDEKSQREWQTALTLITDKGKYKVRDSSNSIALVDVTREQLIAVGNEARKQQIAAYEWFMKIRDAINNCKNEDELSAYIT